LKSRIAKNVKKNSKFNRTSLNQAAEMMKALGHPLRLSLLCTLIEGGEMTAGDLVERWGSHHGQSQISQYLGALRELGYVAARRDGQNIWYRIQSPEVEKVVATLHDLYCK
jgi:ArsR family transcriptional regulator, virulence genes transcriptional regulator